MDTDTDADETVESLVDPGEKLVVLTDCQLGSDGRLTIPASTRERYELGEGDFVDAFLVVPQQSDEA